MKSLLLLSFLTLSLFTTSCYTHKVERVDVNEKIDLSGSWNDTDSRMVAEEMVAQILSGGWLTEFSAKNPGKKPVVVVGLVYNKSHEHISSDTYIKDIEKAFINSGKVRIAQAGDKREELRKERAGQQEYASQETTKKWGVELGADFLLTGDINSIVDQYKKEKVIYYQVNLNLSDIETNEIVWVGDKKLKKYTVN